MSLNRDMSDAHEEFLVALFGGRRSKGSGNQWTDPIDGRQSRMHQTYAFAWDGKSTMGKSVGISEAMIAKARAQAGAERPMIALRWYHQENLKSYTDWVAVSIHDFAEILEAANRLKELEQAVLELKRAE